jgi:branched-chain amino acid transport system permease protein
MTVAVEGDTMVSGDSHPHGGGPLTRSAHRDRPSVLVRRRKHAMNATLLLVQALNGLQFGLILFLIAAGLTLIFGVMDFINLAHGVQYMVGAYLAAAFASATGSFGLALLLALPTSLAFGLLLEVLIFRHLYDRDHLDQVLATFGVILFLNQGVKFLWGAAPLNVPVPELLSGSMELMDGLLYPVYRLAIIVAGLGVAALLYVLVHHTRIGMLVRAGASNAPMVSALGVNIKRLFMVVFGFGAMLAGFAGAMVAPILSVEPGMGDNILILGFVVIVIGGIGSIRGAFLAALLIGLVDTIGRTFAPNLLRLMLDPATASQTGRALAPMLIYILMAAVLFFRPSGLFPVKR